MKRSGVKAGAMVSLKCSQDRIDAILSGLEKKDADAVFVGPGGHLSRALGGARPGGLLGIRGPARSAVEANS